MACRPPRTDPPSELSDAAGPRGEVEEWEILDPIGMDVDVYREVRDEIENRVMRVILAARGELRGNCEVPPADRRKFLR